ncbi:MAG: carbohydrate kinase family protein [Candidatus Heimdallarchaeota archaeon]
MLNNRIFCLGHISVDIFISRATLEEISAKIGGCIQSQDLVMHGGGDAANVAYWLAAKGRPVSFFGVIAKDPMGEFLRNDLEQVGVNCFLKKSQDYPTASILVIIEPNGERSFVQNGESQNDLLWKDLPLTQIFQSGIIYTSAYTLERNPIKSTMKRLFQYIKHQEKKSPEVIFNLASFTTIEKCRDEIINGILPFTDILIGNRNEFLLLVQHSKWKEWSKVGLRLIRQSPHLHTVLITDGENGCYYITKDMKGHIAAPKVNVIDTTGAGDGFSAGFIAGYTTLERDIPKSVELGVKLGSEICKGFGARYNPVRF